MQVIVNNHNTYSFEKKDNEWFESNQLILTDIQWANPMRGNIILNNKSYEILVDKVDQQNKELTIRINGSRYTLQIKEDIDILLSNMGINLANSHKASPLKAPMPGMILKLLVTEGQEVQKGDPLLILEAMKMENVLKATSNATIKSIKISEKTAVEKGVVLIEME